MKDINPIQPKYYDEMPKEEQRALYNEYNAANPRFFLFKIFKSKKKFFNWLENSKKVFENREVEYFKVIDDCKGLDEQYKIIRDCVQRAIDKWIRADLTGNYSIESFESVRVCVSNEISASIIHNKGVDIKTIEKSITENYFDEFNDETLTNDFPKIAAQIFQNLSILLPENSKFILPEHLWSYWDDYWS